MKLTPIVSCLVFLSCSCHTAALQGQKLEDATTFYSLPVTDTKEETKLPVIVDGFKKLMLTSEVTDGSVAPLIKELSDNTGLSGYILEINSPGGSVDAGFLLSKAIENAGVPVYCFVDGDGASMAFYILQSCTTRAMTKRSVLMVHGPSMSGQHSGNTSKWLEVGEQLEAIQNAMIEHCGARLKVPLSFLRHKILLRAWWLNWQEALGVGAIDGVTSGFNEVLSNAKKLKK